MVIRLSEDPSFAWQSVAEDIMRETISRNPRLFEEFVSATTNRRRMELCLTDRRLISAIDSKVWNRFDRFCEGKDDLESAEFRSAGNDHFRRKNLDSAIAAYSMAVFKAEPESEAFALAVANRSACLLETGEFEECLEDVERTLAAGKYPERLKRKILNRKLECLKRLKRGLKEARETIEEIRSMAGGGGEGVLEDFDGMWKQYEEEWNREKDVGSGQDAKDCSPAIESCGFNDLKIEESALCNRVSVHFSEDLGRHVITNEDVEVGHKLVEEKAFAHILIADSQSLNCQLCLTAKPNLIPCSFCSDVGYCGEKCRDEAWKMFHEKECAFMSLLPGIGIAHLSYRIVNQVGVTKVVETLKKAEENEGRPFDRDDLCPDYDSVFSLLTHENETAPEDLFQYALTAVLMLKMISAHEEHLKAAFEKLSNSSGSAYDGAFDDLLTVGQVLLKHVQQLICNASAVTAVVSTPFGDSTSSTTTTEDQVRIATAIFPRLSLLNHSCDPNVIVSYVGTTVTAKATRPIKGGHQVFNCYGPHHLRMNLAERRNALRQQYHFHCVCDKCEEEERVKGDKKREGGRGGGVEEDNDNDSASKSTAKALKCPKCEGPLISSENSRRSFSCLNCDLSLDGKEAKELVAKVQELIKKRDAVKVAAESVASLDASSQKSLKSMVAEAEKLLFKDSLDLAETYDLVAFVLTNRDDFKNALSYVKKSSNIVQSVYGETSVEFGYELRKLGEVALRLDDIRGALEATRQSKSILERCYSARHKDVAELAEAERQLENILG